MRKNLPVTATEFPITDETLIVSRTDLKGKLTYFNDQFVAAAGFAPDELIGQPHNIVRHPDMPEAAFENLWQTLKDGKPWSGAVKNRRKNGDFYWVLANASPIRENGEVTGFTSVRTKLAPEDRAEAEKVYALMRANKGQEYQIGAGIIRRRSVLDKLSFFTGTLRARLTTLVAILSFFMLVAGVSGLLSTNASNRRMQSIYEDRTIPLAQLFEINDRMLQNTAMQFAAAADGRASRPVGDIAAAVNGNIDKISRVWGDYLATYLTPEERMVAERFTAKRLAYAENAVKPSLALLGERKFDEASSLLAGKARQLFDDAKHELDALVAYLQTRGRDKDWRPDNDYEK